MILTPLGEISKMKQIINPWYNGENSPFFNVHDEPDLIEGNLEFYSLMLSVIVYDTKLGKVITECVTIEGAKRHLAHWPN